jgi:hypothetical protein
MTLKHGSFSTEIQKLKILQFFDGANLRVFLIGSTIDVNTFYFLFDLFFFANCGLPIGRDSRAANADWLPKGERVSCCF